jgi:hypothetical protein
VIELVVAAVVGAIAPVLAVGVTAVPRYLVRMGTGRIG